MTKIQVLEAAIRGEGCLGKAADDEPVFVLRAQDLLAYETLRHWIYTARMNEVDADKIDGVVDDLEQFRQWSMDHTTKLPD